MAPHSRGYLHVRGPRRGANLSHENTGGPTLRSRAPLDRWREATKVGEIGDEMKRWTIAMLIIRNGIDQQNRGWFSPNRHHLARACYGIQGMWGGLCSFVATKATTVCWEAPRRVIFMGGDSRGVSESTVPIIPRQPIPFLFRHSRGDIGSKSAHRPASPLAPQPQDSPAPYPGHILPISPAPVVFDQCVCDVGSTPSKTHP